MWATEHTYRLRPKEAAQVGALTHAWAEGSSMCCFVARMEDDVRAVLYDLLRPFPFSTPVLSAYSSSKKHRTSPKYMATAPGLGFRLRTDSHVQKASQEIRVGRNVNSPPCTLVVLQRWKQEAFVRWPIPYLTPYPSSSQNTKILIYFWFVA